jgi:hypothetical protein
MAVMAVMAVMGVVATTAGKGATRKHILQRYDIDYGVLLLYLDLFNVIVSIASVTTFDKIPPPLCCLGVLSTWFAAPAPVIVPPVYLGFSKRVRVTHQHSMEIRHLA